MAKTNSQKSYSKFTYKDLWDLGLHTIVVDLFEPIEVKKVQPSPWLLETLKINQPVSLATEKAKSEFVISPILSEVRQHNSEVFAIYSGFNFDIDRKRGLQGFCDYLLAKLPLSVVPETPIIAVVEAKHNQDLPDAVPQCAAEMFAARLWNEQRMVDLPCIYGVITSADSWLFIKLLGDTIYVDNRRFTINNIPELLGAWQAIIETFKN